jgi:hypothetical protein
MAKTTKTVKATKPAPEKKATPAYALEVSVNDIEFKTTGKTLAEALAKFVESGEFPYGVKTRVAIKYSKGKETGKKLMHVPEARRIFNMISAKPTALELFAARLESTLS